MITLTDMSDIQYYVFLFFLWIISALLFRSFVKKHSGHCTSLRLPPSPPALPIIGHLHLLGPIIHKSFQSLSKRYGPLMSLRMGTSSFIVASTAAIAKEVLKTHELNFTSRPQFAGTEYNMYGGSGFFGAPYGTYWRFMKKLCMTELLGGWQLKRFTGIQEQEIHLLLQSLFESSTTGKPVNLSAELTRMTNNIICTMAMSTKCSVNQNEAEKCRMMVKEGMKLAEKLRFGEVLGPLKKLDLFGYGKRIRKLINTFDELFERIMKEHEERRIVEGSEREDKDLMDVLLEIHQDEKAEFKLTRNNIKAFLLDLFFGGTETVAVALQWALTELINCPNMFMRVREEIELVVGRNRLVEQSDIPNLLYLQAVVKETLRLHPPAPMLTRECSHDCKIGEFDVVRKTNVVINVYSIMRDPNSWEDPDEFRPERFLMSSEESFHNHMDIKGQNFNLLPFGSGRRGCPGSSHALNVLHSTIASMVQCFDLKVHQSNGASKVHVGPGPEISQSTAPTLICVPIGHYNPSLTSS